MKGVNKCESISRKFKVLDSYMRFVILSEHMMLTCIMRPLFREIIPNINLHIPIQAKNRTLKSNYYLSSFVPNSNIMILMNFALVD